MVNLPQILPKNAAQFANGISFMLEVEWAELSPVFRQGLIQLCIETHQDQPQLAAELLPLVWRFDQRTELDTDVVDALGLDRMYELAQLTSAEHRRTVLIESLAAAAAEVAHATLTQRIEEDRPPNRARELSHLAMVDPDQAMKLAGEIPDEMQRQSTLLSIARQLEDVDPVQSRAALHHARPDETVARSLLRLGESVLATNPDFARALFNDAIHTKHVSPNSKDRFRRQIAQLVAGSDLNWALEVTSSIQDDDARWECHRQLVAVVAKSSAAEATELAESTPEPHRAESLAHLALALAQDDPAQAVEIASRPEIAPYAARALSVAAKALAATDPVSAEAVVASMTGPGIAWSLHQLARDVQVQHPQLALDCWTRSRHAVGALEAESSAQLLSGIAIDLCAVDIDAAMETASEIVALDESHLQSWYHELAVTAIAQSLARSDLTRACEQARLATSPMSRASVLAVICNERGAPATEETVAVAREALNLLTQAQDGGPNSEPVVAVAEALARVDLDLGLKAITHRGGPAPHEGQQAILMAVHRRDPTALLREVKDKNQHVVLCLWLAEYCRDLDAKRPDDPWLVQLLSLSL